MNAKPFEVLPGVPYPLGAHVDGRGVNFAVYSENASGLDLCLFDETDSNREVARLPLRDVTNHVWHGYVPGLKEGALYGFRAHGPFSPSDGQWFNPHKLLVDPYARTLVGKPDLTGPVSSLGPVVDGKDTLDTRDSAPFTSRSMVVGDAFDWGSDARPNIVWRKTILYETHVKGFTAQHPRIPRELRGTYAGLAHPEAIAHLVSLGVTSVQLLPVHESVSEGFLAARGVSNYWGYNTLGFFAPDQRFASGQPGDTVREFKAMVKALHAAGLEVILDVVFNHTCEGNHLGPTLSFRGLDNSTYYWLDGKKPGRSLDFTGCGNSLDVSHPQVLKMVCDSLRYWVNDMHVDGFRFDLCTTLGRTGDGGFDMRAPFFAAVLQDPVLSRVKLIAEPWDVGPGGYRVGQFPQLFAEWNDRYKETMRRYWRGDERMAGELGYRFTGSSDLFKLSGRRPTASINYITSHDGFTLADLVSYSRKHNELNGEYNRDGADENHAWNCGVEGEATDPKVRALRAQQQRNFLATLFLSHGTPMLCGGDEMGRTQHGNNNAYCQDNELSWVDWALDEDKAALLEFTRACIALRKEHPVLQRRNFFQGATLDDSRFHDLVWFRPDGKEMQATDWALPYVRCLGMFLGGDALATRDPSGKKVQGDTLLMYFNAHHEVLELTLPDSAWGEGWEVVLDTLPQEDEPKPLYKAQGRYPLAARSLVVMRQRSQPS